MFEVTWIQSILHELLLSISGLPTIYLNNLSATYTCANPIFHTRMKHLALDYFFVREKVNSKQMQVKHVPSVYQIVDALIKQAASLSNFFT